MFSEHSSLMSETTCWGIYLRQNVYKKKNILDKISNNDL